MEKKLIITARVISMIFNPFYLPLVGLILLFWLSHLSLMPTLYKFSIIINAYLFTILFPTVLIRLYNNYHGRKFFHLGQKEKRMVPYIISIVSYFTCYYIMSLYHVPHVISCVIIAALTIQMLCAFINVWWKISTHSAGVGAMTGALIVFSFGFGFYLLWWLSFALLISGIVGSSRLILRQHTLSQVIIGYLVGLFVAPLIIVFM